MKWLQTFAACLAILVTLPSQSAETSKSHSLGFSLDGTTFAFEEYGISDGIGLPYVSIFAIDVLNDKWLEGSPIRLKMKEGDISEPGEGVNLVAREKRLLDEMRFKARNQAIDVLKSAGELGYGEQRVHNLPWELGTDTKTVRFTERNYIPSDGKGWRLELEEIDFPANEKCYDQHKIMKGFRLNLIDEVTGVTKTIHDDTKIPASRPCPLNYRIEEVITHASQDGPTVYAIMIRYQTIGFEGPDGRLIAITGRLR